MQDFKLLKTKYHKKNYNIFSSASLLASFKYNIVELRSFLNPDETRLNWVLKLKFRLVPVSVPVAATCVIELVWRVFNVKMQIFKDLPSCALHWRRKRHEALQCGCPLPDGAIPMLMAVNKRQYEILMLTKKDSQTHSLLLDRPISMMFLSRANLKF